MTPQKNTSANRPAPLQADKMISTFYWEMFLDKNHPQNSVDKLTGYSKFQNHDEAKDKKQMLMRKIIMLHSQGYIERSTRIEVFQRTGDFINKTTDTQILILQKNDCTIHERVMKDFAFVQFIQKFYQFRKEGKEVQTLLPKPNATFSKDEYLNIDLQFRIIGTSELKLASYCSRLIRNGHPFGAVNNFYNCYKEKYIDKNNGNNFSIQPK